MTKRIKKAATLFGMVCLLGACSEAPKTEAKPAEASNEPAQSSALAKTVEIKVAGMTCAACESAISSKLKAMPGVVDCKASHKEQMVRVTLNSGQSDLAQIKGAIKDLGYEVP